MGRKIIVIGVLLFISTLSADRLRIGLKGGLNHQTFDSGEWNVKPGSGLGFHGGLSFEVYLTPSILPVQFGIEGELLNQRANYNWETPFNKTYMGKRLNNLVIPFLMKVRVGIPMLPDLETGLGLSLVRNLSGQWGLKGETGEIWLDMEEKDLQTDLGFQFKGEIGIKVAPLLKVTPGFVYQKNLTQDDPNTDNKEKESAGFFCCGIYLSL